MSTLAGPTADHTIKLILESKSRLSKAGVAIRSVPTEVIGAYGERVAARLLKARVVSGPGIDDHDLLRKGDKVEVKASMINPKHIGDLRGKVRDRVAFVELAVIDGRLHVTGCSFYENANVYLGRRPGRTGFLQRACSFNLSRPIRLLWRVSTPSSRGSTRPSCRHSALIGRYRKRDAPSCGCIARAGGRKQRLDRLGLGLSSRSRWGR